MSEATKKARIEYMREYRSKNKDELKRNQARCCWERETNGMD